jgi:CubicO group peptidase (beta-lactamase class C family)
MIDLCSFLAVILLVLHPSSFSDHVASNECSPPKLQQFAQQWAEQHQFSGVLLIEQHQRVLAEMAFGEADREHHAPNTPVTPFRIGSITKLFTTAAILHEVAEHRLELGTSICKFLPSCPASWEGITVEQALTHTDGLPDIVRQPDFPALVVQPTTPAATLGHLYGALMLFSPGTDVAYGNTGMLALSAILEKLTGMQYGEALDVLVLHPGALKRTAYDDPAIILPGRARGYVIHDGKVQNAPYINMTLPSGAGGLVSTVGDLDRFTREFLSGMGMPKELVQQSLTPKNSDYGFGWAIRSARNEQEISHIGDINGFGSFLAYYPTQDIITVVLTNVERTPAAGFARSLAQQCGAPDIPNKR